MVFIGPWNIVSHAFLCLFQDQAEMENIGFDEEDIPLINQDKEYDDYWTPETSRVDQTSFTDTAEVTSTSWLRQKLNRDKIVSVIKALQTWIDLWLKKIQKEVILNCFFSMIINIGNPLIINELVSF